MESSFLEKFKTKTSAQLLEIIGSTSYQEAARNAATNLIVERGEMHLLAHSKLDFSQLQLDELLGRLTHYQYEFERTSKSLKIFRDDRKGLTGTILFFFGVACVLYVLFNLYRGNTSLSLGYSISLGLLSIGLGWRRLKHSNYSYLKIDGSGISLRSSDEEIKNMSHIQSADFERFSIHEHSGSVSILMDSKTCKSLSVLNLQLKAYESTIEFANELTERLNTYVTA
jgi:hypothetical protein